MLFTAEQEHRLTFPEWENLVIEIDMALRETVSAHQPGYEAVADELLSIYLELTTDVLPSWA